MFIKQQTMKYKLSNTGARRRPPVDVVKILCRVYIEKYGGEEVPPTVKKAIQEGVNDFLDILDYTDYITGQISYSMMEGAIRREEWDYTEGKYGLPISNGG